MRQHDRRSHQLRCCACGRVFQCRRIDAATCSAKCRKAVSRATQAGKEWKWGELVAIVVPDKKRAS